MTTSDSSLKNNYIKCNYPCDLVRQSLCKPLLALLTVLSFSPTIRAQTTTTHNLQQKLQLLQKNKDCLTDTAYVNTLNDLAFIYADSYPDSAIALLKGQAERCKSFGYHQGQVGAYTISGNAYQTKGDFKKAMDYYDLAYVLAKEISFDSALPGIMNDIGLVYLNQGNYPMALDKFYQALRAAETVHNSFVTGSILNNIATIHFFQKKMEEAAADYRRMLSIANAMSDTVGIIMAYNNIGEVKLEQDSARKALEHLTTAFNLAVIARNPEMLAASTKNLGNVYFKLDSLSKSISYFDTAIALSRQQGNTMSACKALIGLAKAQYKEGRLNAALANALESVGLANNMGQTQLLRDASEITAAIYEAQGDGIRALQHYRVYKVSSDSINNAESERAAATYKAEYTFSKKELEFQRKDLQQRWLILSSLAALLLLSVIVWMVNRNRKRLNQANIGLHHKNELIEAEKVKVEDTLKQLKATQSQLVQAEKMASLGELVAGIAHEIQNPLNFVNNFSDINKELLAEMQGQIEKGNLEEARSIAADVMDNEDKISHHGKRADAIVRGMLQHSRSSTGMREPADINALAGEYFRLSYLGLRSKDPSFNPVMQTDLDPAIKTINVIPQDIGRVLLNLYNNAFYAVKEKNKLNIKGYEPCVSVSTKREGNKIHIRVKDNGTGIPGRIVDKIFQPFFTTKPTGQGTGLGLSLSYDIITKGHGGSLSVETTEGEGSEFVIVLEAE